MKIEILLLIIPFIYWFIEIVGVVRGLENKKYIYNDEMHSVEHFVYLCSYLITTLLLIFYIYTMDNVVLCYFVFMFIFSSLALIRHIQKERLK